MYTVTQLITNAFYASGIVSREFQQIDGNQINDGLDWLNDILGEMRVDDGMIPYYREHTFSTVTGQQTYTIADLIQVDTATFLLDTVRYAMTQIPRNQYFGSSRAETITSLPLTYHVERQKGGANIYLYFLPNQVYPVTLWGLFSLAEVVYNQDLSQSLDRFYISFLKFALAERICVEFNVDVPMNVEKTLLKLRGAINKKSQQMDLRMTKISTLSGGVGLNYGQVNIGRGFTVANGGF